jgi:hypothetical protein
MKRSAGSPAFDFKGQIELEYINEVSERALSPTDFTGLGSGHAIFIPMVSFRGGF